MTATTDISTDRNTAEDVRRLLVLAAVRGHGPTLSWPALSRAARAGHLDDLWYEHDGANQTDAHDRVRHHLDVADSCGARVVTVLHPDYPQRLRAWADAPPVLFVVGEAPLTCPLLAVTGSRSPSDIGKNAATRLSREVSRTGTRVAVGPEAGIDAIARESSGTPAVTVWGAGISSAPSGFDPVISPFWPEQPFTRQTGSIGRLVLAALCDAVVLADATTRSPARETATAAIRMRRTSWLPSRLVSREPWASILVGRGEARVLRRIADLAPV